ncbi:MAG TPA: YciI family protein [Pseudonocardiaceae bacterium]|jgi:hypothetical protein
MRYLLLINNDADYLATADPADFEAMRPEYFTFTEEIRESGEFQHGEALQAADTATTVRVRNGETLVTDGPFAETREVLGGFYLVDCKDLDRAIELASRIPGARDGSVEIRPIQELAMPDEAS